MLIAGIYFETSGSYTKSTSQKDNKNLASEPRSNPATDFFGLTNNMKYCFPIPRKVELWHKVVVYYYTYGALDL